MRKTELVHISAEGRDKGKVFLLTEMDAFAAEEWAGRAFTVLAAGRVELPDWIPKMGMAGLAIVGLKALEGVEFDKVKPLMEQMMTCVQIVPDRNHTDFARPINRDADDIEEVRTILFLRNEVFRLHTGFSFTDATSNLTSASGMKKSPDLSTTPMSPAPSVQ